MISTLPVDDLEVDEALERYWAENVTPIALPFISREFKRSILPALKATFRRNGYTLDQYKSMWIQAWDVTDQLFNALHPYPIHETEKPSYFWQHQRFDIFRTDDPRRGFKIMKDELLSAAALYLGHPDIRTNKLDWLFLDAIIFQELNAYGEHVLATKSGTGTNWAAVFAQGSQPKYYGYQILFSLAGFGWSFLLLPIAAYFLTVHGHETGAIVALVVWVISLGLTAFAYPARKRKRQKATALLQHLISLYSLLDSATISPRKLKETLDAAAAAGVVLDGTTFTIVDRLIALDPTAFLPNQASY
jgi:hypothetical protein